MATVLVIDDEPDIREVMRFALEEAGFRVLEAGHADEARKTLLSDNADLILLDWMLPGRSGLELAKGLKQSSRTRRIPIIMVSAKGEEEDRVRGLETGADDYIAKPFSPREMVARVNAGLRRSRPGDLAAETSAKANRQSRITIRAGAGSVRTFAPALPSPRTNRRSPALPFARRIPLLILRTQRRSRFTIAAPPFHVRFQRYHFRRLTSLS